MLRQLVLLVLANLWQGPEAALHINPSVCVPIQPIVRLVAQHLVSASLLVPDLHHHRPDQRC